MEYTWLDCADSCFAGTQHGDIITLRNQGLQQVGRDPHSRGDHFVTIALGIPVLDGQQLSTVHTRRAPALSARHRDHNPADPAVVGGVAGDRLLQVLAELRAIHRCKTVAVT